MMEEKQVRQPTWKTLLILEAATLGAGGIVAFLTRDQDGFYDSLQKPAFAPPGWLFPVVWGLLYAAMALAMYLVLRKQGKDRFLLLGLYIAQLAVNLIWPFLFFVQQALGLSFFWLVLLLALVLIMMVQFFRQSAAAGWLISPYLAWVGFAGLLNFILARMNGAG